jgi:hypothetical protein
MLLTILTVVGAGLGEGATPGLGLILGVATITALKGERLSNTSWRSVPPALPYVLLRRLLQVGGESITQGLGGNLDQRGTHPVWTAAGFRKAILA